MSNRRCTVNRRAIGARCLLLAMGLLAANSEAAAQWEVRERANGQPPVATVRGDNDETLRVFVNPQRSVVLGTLILAPGLAPLHADGCPTFQVDSRKPGSLASAGTCNVNGRSVTFVLGAAENDSIKSRALREMMGGRRMSMTYRYDGLGYDTANFALRGSLQALLGALRGWKVVGAP